MVVLSAQGSGRFEKAGSYARAKRVGPFVFVAGTTAMQPDGNVYAPYDTYEQTKYIFDRISEVLDVVGSDISHVVRTRAFVTDMRDGAGFIKAHGEVFQGIEPVLTGVEAGLTTPGMMVEVEVDAVIHGPNGEVSFD